jgi:oxygen-independent coproporphyrinogen-3 oxidase
VPFCEQKCSYCDFFTITDPQRTHPLASRWLELCSQELQLWREAGDVQNAPIETVYFGGGTPSLLEAGAIGDFLQEVRAKYGFAPGAEVTLETQPNTVDATRLLQLADAGINRFSIGVQTFDPTILAATGRRHSVQQARDCILAAQKTGAVVSIDLIAAWPGQTLAAWEADLDEAISFGAPHISVYELTYHEGTQMHRDQRAGRIAEVDEDTRAEMFKLTRSTLIAAGYDHYEISNYARAGARSLHNQNYWQLGNYIGLGAGAHSLVFPNRYANANSAGDYARAIDGGRLFRRLANPADPDVFFAENAMMALRLLDGVEVDMLRERFGEAALQKRGSSLQRLQEAGLVELRHGRLCLTEQGELQADTVTMELL